MKKALLLFALAISLAATAQFSTQTISINGTNRQFRQYLPSGLSNSEHVPLVIALHGLGDDMQNFSNVGFSWFADTARFICLFPQGLQNTLVGAASWNNGTLLASTADDIGLINALIDSMYVQYGIDLSRVYVCGFSMGGIMSYHTTCALPYRIAAMASVSGTMSDSDVQSCNPGRAIPVMHMHGTADGTVPYDAGKLPSLSLVPTTLAFWKANNGHTDSTMASLPDAVSSDGITVDKFTYTGGNAEFNFWRENGADHQWLYYPANDIDATIEIWLFFRNKVHPNVSQVGVNEMAASAKLLVFQSGSDVVVKADKALQAVEVYDMQGKLLSKANAPQNTTEIRLNLSQQASQMVLVKTLVSNVWVTKRVALMAN